MQRATPQWRCKACLENDQPIDEVSSIKHELDKKSKGITQQQLRILQWNANGIFRELPLLKDRLASLKIDVACIQETKLLPSDRTPELRQYAAIRQDWHIQGEARGGGLLIFVRKTLPYRIAPLLTRAPPAF